MYQKARIVDIDEEDGYSLYRNRLIGKAGELHSERLDDDGTYTGWFYFQVPLHLGFLRLNKSRAFLLRAKVVLLPEATSDE